MDAFGHDNDIITRFNEITSAKNWTVTVLTLDVASSNSPPITLSIYSKTRQFLILLEDYLARSTNLSEGMSIHIYESGIFFFVLLF